MSYTKHNFQSGEKLYASQLNAMDDQIALNESRIDEIEENATVNYNNLTNKPSLNGVTLSGDMTSADLGIPSAEGIPDMVDDWLDENISNPDSPPLDRSLSSSSAAAPADLVGEELTSIKQDLSEMSGSGEIPIYAESGYFDLSAASVTMSDGVPQLYSSGGTSYNARMMQCSAGDKFTVNGIGGVKPRLWGFLSAEGTVLACANQNISATNLVITAPDSAEWVIVHTNDGSQSYYGIPLPLRLNSIDGQLIDIRDGVVSIPVDLGQGYVYNNGAITTGDASTAYVYTKNIIGVTPGEIICVDLAYSETRNMWIRLSTYSANGQWTSNSGGEVSGQYESYHAEFVVKDNAYGIRISFKSYNDIKEFHVYRKWKLIDDIENDITELQSDVEGVPSVIDDATKSKYLDYRADMVSIIKSGTLQLFDSSQYEIKTQATSYKYYQNVNIDFSQNGIYYMNPIGKANIYQMYFYDSEDNKLTIDGASYVTVGGFDELERVDDTHVTVREYTYESNFYSRTVRSTHNYTISGTISYVIISRLCNYSVNGSMDIGITFNEFSRVFVPFGVNHEYNTELAEGVWKDWVDNNRFYDVPAKRLNPWMQRSYELTDNLLDDRKINWIGSGEYYTMKPGERIPVEGGRVIRCNKYMYSLYWYDENGVGTSLGNVGYGPVTLPDEAVSVRFAMSRSGSNPSGAYIPADVYYPPYLYYADSVKTYVSSDVDRLPTPMAQMNGWDINKNIFNYVIPDEDSSIVRMMKTFAIREINHQRNAFRIGTFNVYINYNRTNRPTIRKELETYGIDMCCFQETRIRDGSARLNLGDYLTGWQFKYHNTNEEDFDNARAIVSAYEILSSEAFVYDCNSSSSFLKCVIQLPRYKDYYHGETTLSLYTYHGDVNSATTRGSEVDEILAKIAEDTSDFIVVTGDTNDFSTNKAIWNKFRNAGLTPVHNGESSTITGENTDSLDNIFISEHITCLYYDVVRSVNFKYTEPSGGTPHSVSDHDLVYADLQFDFATVLAERTNN